MKKNCWKNVSLFGCLTILALFVAVPAHATSMATAYTDLDLASATFSGAVVTNPPVGPVYGQSFGINSYTEASGWDQTTKTFAGNSNAFTGWGPSTSSQIFGPSNYATATANTTDFTALSSITGNYQLIAQVEFQAFILCTDGTVSIGVPYTFVQTINSTPDVPYATRTVAWIEFYSVPGYPSVFKSYQIDNSTSTDYFSNGVISLEFTNLATGYYWFDIGDASITQYVAPEPTTMLLLGLGLVGLAGVRRKFRN
jgi:PEP-CTERM motif